MKKYREKSVFAEVADKLLKHSTARKGSGPETPLAEMAFVG
jgi:hypothetical protein